ncbi:MAG TPA: hypothetical protein VGM56_18795, partial [Byssovorax sp.]
MRAPWNASSRGAIALAAVVACSCLPAVDSAVAPAVHVEPAAVALVGPRASQQLVVSVVTDAGDADRTRAAEFSPVDPRVARVGPTGLVEPVAAGETDVRVRVGGLVTEVHVHVALPTPAPPPRFRVDVEPILTNAGCNAGTCHGSFSGKGG